MNYKITPKQVRYIKTLAGKLFGRDDDAYREMLRGQAKVESCKDLKGPAIDRVIKHLEKSLGKAEVRGPGPGASKGRRAGTPALRQPLRATERQLFIIRSLWSQASRAPAAEREKALRTFLGNRFGMAVPEWLTQAKASAVIEALKGMARRQGPMASGQ